MAVLTDGGLLAAATAFGTPVYVYDLGALTTRYQALDAAFAPYLSIRYAVKANPNEAVLKCLLGLGALIDASSIGEVRRAVAAGTAPELISFTGPGKRRTEIAEAVALRIGALVLESPGQAVQAQAEAAQRGLVQKVLLRVSPHHSPRGFGARMTGHATQFGVDEEDAAQVLADIAAMPNLALEGLHFYSGSNSLEELAIAENFGIFTALSIRLGDPLALPFRRLVFGSGFGVPYHDGQRALDLPTLATGVLAAIAPLAENPKTAAARLDLELGRWLVAPAGVLLTSVLTRKQSRAATVLICDAGFNAHMAACGMMGSVLRRNWPIRTLCPQSPVQEKVTVAGPLCTSIDQLARDLEIARADEGDVLEVAMSGAYGLTASPVGFISHEVTRELVWTGSGMVDVTGAGAAAVHSKCGDASGT